MRAESLRRFTRVAPLPGRLMRPMLDVWEPLVYPKPPIEVVAHAGRFEIRNFVEYIQRNVYFRGSYEIRETRTVEKWLRSGDIFIDVGANIGWFTVLAGRRVGPSGRVIAFEPSSAVFSHLERNVCLNGLANVTVENCAVAAVSGKSTLSRAHDRNHGTASIVKPGNPSSSSEVAVVRLDDYCRSAGVDRVRLLKIDVEGAESLVLGGAQRFLGAASCDSIIVELIDAHLRAAETSSMEVCQYLRDLGCDLFRIGMFSADPIGSNEFIRSENVLAVLRRRV